MKKLDFIKVYYDTSTVGLDDVEGIDIRKTIEEYEKLSATYIADMLPISSQDIEFEHSHVMRVKAWLESGESVDFIEVDGDFVEILPTVRAAMNAAWDTQSFYVEKG